ncbi:MAG TPA: ATP cone domain-containing protein, partial [Acidimicrobiales bacterium]|nr:ATP cone domain-containing protein [Acidimicrobiales bacterium]
MRCPTCTSLDDKVVDSRLADDGVAIRRQRECLGCGRRFTTFERIEEVGLVVVKRSGVREPFRRSKIVAGVRAAAKNRPVSAEQLEGLAGDVEESLRLEGSEASSARV